MERQILQNKTESHKLQTMEQHEMKETAQKSRSSANSKSNTGSMADNTSSSESEFGSYCEITNIKTNKMSLVERQNSQNEEREGLLGAQTQEIHTSPVQGLSQTETCGKCVGNQHYKCENEHVIDMIDAEKELYEQIDSKKFPSTTDTDWTESSISKTKKSKPKRVRNCSSCCCTITLSTVFSVVISVSLMFILLRYSGDTAMMREIQGPAQVPNIGQSSAAEQRHKSGLESFLSNKKSRAQLYLDQRALKVNKKLFWTDKDLQDAFLSHDLSTSTYNDNYGCITVSEEGFYFVFSKLTFLYSQDTSDSVFYHSTNLIRDGDYPRQLSENRYTPPQTETRPQVGNIYWPSILPGYYHLKPNDQVCILVSNIDLVYAAPTHSFLSMYALSND